MIKRLSLCITLLSFFSSSIATKKDCLIDLYRSHSIYNIEACFYDFLGNRKSILIPITSYDVIEKFLIHGTAFDGSSVPGCNRITNSDMLLMPDLTTPTRKVPWTHEQNSTIRIMCSMYSDTNKPYCNDPRVILAKELDTLAAMGYEFHIGPEIEFYVFENSLNNKELKPIDNCCYIDAPHQIEVGNTLISMVNLLNDFELHVEKIHHEVGNGQFEVSLEKDDALAIADAVLATKDALTLLGKNFGKKISFMPKPLAHKPGTGMHINFSLYDHRNQCNAFYDANDSHNLSPLAKSFIAGIIRHAKEISLLLNPTVNSYKRLGGHEAPKFICCGEKNRSALIRIPSSNNQPEAVRAEIRSPDALCNPYLAFAALLRAGLQGIENNYELPELIQENLYTVDEVELEKQGVTLLPQSLEEAINAFENSTIMKDLLGGLFEKYLDHKKQELADFSSAVTNWELDHYL